MTDTALYTAFVDVVGGRAGHATSRSGSLDLDLSRPAERGIGGGTDPEELFAAGFAACFGGALDGAARKRSARLGPVTITGAVSLHSSPEDGYFISVALTVTAPECEQALLEELVADAEAMCPYAKATRGNIQLTLDAVGRS